MNKSFEKKYCKIKIFEYMHSILFVDDFEFLGKCENCENNLFKEDTFADLGVFICPRCEYEIIFQQPIKKIDFKLEVL